jgi:hypothetical protein
VVSGLSTTLVLGTPERPPLNSTMGSGKTKINSLCPTPFSVGMYAVRDGIKAVAITTMMVIRNLKITAID